MPGSGIRALHELKRPTSIDLSIGQPSLEPEPEPFDAAARWVREHGCSYAPYAGIPELRAAAAQAYGGRFHSSPSHVCVTNGSQEAIYLAVKTLLEPGRDEVLLTDPGYPSYARCCDLEGVTWRALRLSPDDGFTVKAAALLDALTPRTRALIIGSPSNPTGAVMPRLELEALVSGLRQCSDPPLLIVDEVYRELVYGSDPFCAVADLDADSIAVQSLSKSCALTGLRLGFLFAHEAVIEPAMRVHTLMLMSVSQLSQRVGLEFVRSSRRLHAHRDWYVKQRQIMLDAARNARLEVIEPQGAFYTLIKLPQRWHGRSSDAAADLLELYDVVSVAGSVFGNGTRDYLRVTWSAPAEAVREGFARIGEFCDKSG